MSRRAKILKRLKERREKPTKVSETPLPTERKKTEEIDGNKKYLGI